MLGSQSSRGAALQLLWGLEGLLGGDLRGGSRGDTGVRFVICCVHDFVVCMIVVCMIVACLSTREGCMF